MTEGDLKLYSADRRKLYGAGPLVLTKTTYSIFRPFEDNRNVSAITLGDHIQELFPDGLSIHGWLFAAHTLQAADGINPSATLELVFEYVRRAAFPHMPSRFQSFFAFDDLKSVEEFAESTAPGCRIVELKPAAFKKVDWEWLKVTPQLAGTSFAAQQYWMGAATPKPKWEYLLVPPVEVIEINS